MKTQIIEEIKNLEKKGIAKIDLLALVTDTSYEIVFYGDINGKKIQSNNMVEEDLIDSRIIDDFYEKINQIIANSEEFDKEKMNIVKVNNKYEIYFEKENRDIKVYKIKKEWRNTI